MEDKKEDFGIGFNNGRWLNFPHSDLSKVADVLCGILKANGIDAYVTEEDHIHPVIKKSISNRLINYLRRINTTKVVNVGSDTVNVADADITYLNYPVCVPRWLYLWWWFWTLAALSTHGWYYLIPLLR